MDSLLSFPSSSLGQRRHANSTLDELRIAVGAGRVGVGRARVVRTHVVGQGMAAGVEDGAGDGAVGGDVEGEVGVGVVLVETENREVRFLVEGVMGCLLGAGLICPMSELTPDPGSRIPDPVLTEFPYRPPGGSRQR